MLLKISELIKKHKVIFYVLLSYFVLVGLFILFVNFISSRLYLSSYFIKTLDFIDTRQNKIKTCGLYTYGYEETKDCCFGLEKRVKKIDMNDMDLTSLGQPYIPYFVENKYCDWKPWVKNFEGRLNRTNFFIDNIRKWVNNKFYLQFQQDYNINWRGHGLNPK